jgi:hypothetical protein
LLKTGDLLAYSLPGKEVGHASRVLRRVTTSGLAEESFLASVGSHPCREESASTMGRPAFIFIRLEKVG